MTVIRIVAMIVFLLLALGGLATWATDPWPRSAFGCSAFLAGLIGLLLSDVAMSLDALLDVQRHAFGQQQKWREEHAAEKLLRTQERTEADEYESDKVLSQVFSRSAGDDFDAAIDEAIGIPTKRKAAERH